MPNRRELRLHPEGYPWRVCKQRSGNVTGCRLGEQWRMGCKTLHPVKKALAQVVAEDVGFSIAAKHNKLPQTWPLKTPPTCCFIVLEARSLRRLSGFSTYGLTRLTSRYQPGRALAWRLPGSSGGVGRMQLLVAVGLWSCVLAAVGWGLSAPHRLAPRPLRPTASCPRLSPQVSWAPAAVTSQRKCSAFKGLM